MSKKLEERACAYCENSVETLCDGDFLCHKHGLVAANGKCRKFVYDPQKRKVRPRRPMPTGKT